MATAIFATLFAILMMSLFVVGSWLLSSEGLLLQLLQTEEPPLFIELGTPKVMGNLVAPGLNSEERSLIAERAESRKVLSALADYRLAIKASRVLQVILLLGVCLMMVVNL